MESEPISAAQPSAFVAAVGRSPRTWAPTPPKSALPWAIAAILAAFATIAATFFTVEAVRAALLAKEAGSQAYDVSLHLLTLAAFSLLYPAWRGLQAASRALEAKDLAEARVEVADARVKVWFTFGYIAASLIGLVGLQFLIANELAVGETFFFLPLIYETFPLILKAFWINVEIFCIAQVLVLVWGLAVAVARLAPGSAGRPIRMIATVYVDLFRGLPAIISIYLVGFGLPLTGLPIVNEMNPMWLAILALTLTYGAYVSEVYRSGIESVHWSQTAAARSLGLSYPQTLRHVIVPQAIRRIIPPLLNDFISLQKDTALVSVIGTVDAFNQSKIIASNHFNLSSVTTVAILFVLITIPQARMVDRLMEADQRRMRAGG